MNRKRLPSRFPQQKTESPQGLLLATRSSLNCYPVLQIHHYPIWHLPSKISVIIFLVISLLWRNWYIFIEDISDPIDDPGFIDLCIEYSLRHKRRSAERARRLTMIKPLIQTIPVKYMMAITQFSDLLLFLEGAQTDGTHDIIPHRLTESVRKLPECNDRQVFSNRVSRNRSSNGSGVGIMEICRGRAVGFSRVGYPSKMKRPTHRSLYIR